MDPLIRGFYEQYIDVHLKEKEIKNVKGIVDIFGMSIKNKLDANLGFFVGYSYAQLLMQFLILNNRLPNKEEMTQFFDLMKRRFPEVIREFKKTKGSQVKEPDEEIPVISELDVEPIQQIQD